jgi:nucleoside phosphorylase
MDGPGIPGFQNELTFPKKRKMPTQVDESKRRCTLLLFLATPTEERALEQAVQTRGMTFERIRDPRLPEYHWLGTVGNETVISLRATREAGRVVMGALGRLGSAAKAILFQEATGAVGIVQLGMAFGIDAFRQQIGDVLVSSSLIPYDNRDVRAVPRTFIKRLVCGEGYVTEYPQANRQPARPYLLSQFLREKDRGGHGYGIHVGAVLSGSARIQSRRYRDELARSVPAGDDPIVGGEMEGVGLLAASAGPDNPIWCVVKGISDFADENRDTVIERSREIACRNAAEFVLSALENDARK